MSIVGSLKEAVESGDVPGVAAAAATADGTIFEGAAGVLKADSVIWIASMTKAITGAAAMQMVEAASGLKLDRYMKDNLFDPLEMPDTGFRIGPAMRPRKAAVHVRNEEGGFTATDHELNQAPEVFMGGGALYSTIGDYLRFTRMIMVGGTLDGVRVLKPETVALMSRNAMGDVSCRPLASQLPA